ncbi:hypothetical protein [Nocardia sp. R7R-8]|uniref:hypothetical protein n=1 Tax=Nocardia sp. R7R-8 TaxID=3459304 RepID=UPI00403DC224
MTALTAAGHDVVRGAAPISDNALAGSVARTVAAAGAIPGPLLLLSNIDPVQPGMVGMVAARSDDPAENLAKVYLYPEVFFFPAGGASVHHLAAPGRMTLARLTRLDGDYRMQLMLGDFEHYDEQTNEALMQQSPREWPHAFALLDARAEDFLNRFGADHIHAVPGDHREAVRATCELLDVTVDEFTR